MTDTNTFSKRSTKKNEKNEDLSKNHKRSIRYRLRIQNEKESKEELKDFYNEQDRAS